MIYTYNVVAGVALSTIQHPLIWLRWHRGSSKFLPFLWETIPKHWKDHGSQVAETHCHQILSSIDSSFKHPPCFEPRDFLCCTWMAYWSARCSLYSHEYWLSAINLSPTFIPQVFFMDHTRMDQYLPQNAFIFLEIFDRYACRPTSEHPAPNKTGEIHTWSWVGLRPSPLLHSPSAPSSCHHPGRSKNREIRVFRIRKLNDSLRFFKPLGTLRCFRFLSEHLRKSWDPFLEAQLNQNNWPVASMTSKTHVPQSWLALQLKTERRSW